MARLSAYALPAYLSHVQHAPGDLECPACTRAKTVLCRALSGDLTFSVAFDVWMSHRTIDAPGRSLRARFIAPKTMRDYEVCAKALKKWFGPLRLDQIHEGHLLEYQQRRAANPHDPEGAQSPHRPRSSQAKISRTLRFFLSEAHAR